MSKRYGPMCALVLLASCTGTVGSNGTGGVSGAAGGSELGGGSGSAGAGGGPAPQPSVVEQPLRRLSHFEYVNTLKSLLPQVSVALPTLAGEETIDGFTNHWDAQKPSDLLVEQYFNIALSVAQALDATAIQKLTGCTPGIACASTFIKAFGSRAYRRPLGDDEVTAFLTTFQSPPASADFALAVKLTVMAFLQSPHFLYRPEFGTGPADSVLGKRLTGYETASRLSYLLWGDMPDGPLFDAAATAGLDTQDGIETQARRMLGDPKAKVGVTRFFAEWLKLSKLSKTLKLPAENWDDAFRAELTESVQRFVYDQVFSTGGSAKDLLLSRSFPMTPRIAGLFGLTTTSTSWKTLDADPTQRSGLLTHPGILGAYGYGEYPSPVLRGVFVLDRFMCAPPQAPPNAAFAQPPMMTMTGDTRTNRELYAKATMGAGCPGCHLAINGIGFGFENYDTVGRYRTQDSGVTVDASGSVAGFTFANGVDLSAQLAESTTYLNCVVSNWATYALGGSPLARDAAFLGDLRTRFTGKAFSLKELLIGIATHERFSGRLAGGQGP